MLTPDQIQRALRANYSAPLGLPNSEGPLALDQLAEIVVRSLRAGQSVTGPALIERPIALSVQTWDKLDELARRTTGSDSHRTSASAVAAALLEQCVAGQ